MTPNQVKNKIDDLEFWLKHNPDHPNYTTVLKDKRQLEERLAYEGRCN